jgi:hypothetical protein
MADSGITRQSQQFASEQTWRGVDARQQNMRLMQNEESLAFQRETAQQTHQLNVMKAQADIATEELRRQELQQRMQLTAELRALGMQGLQHDLLQTQVDGAKFQLDQTKAQAQGEFTPAQALELAGKYSSPDNSWEPTSNGRMRYTGTIEDFAKSNEQRRIAEKNASRSNGTDPISRMLEQRMRGLDAVYPAQKAELDRLGSIYTQYAGGQIDAKGVVDLLSASQQNQDQQQQPQQAQPQPQPQQQQQPQRQGASTPTRVEGLPGWMQPGGDVHYATQLVYQPDVTKFLEQPRWSQFIKDDQLSQGFAKTIGRSYGAMVESGMPPDYAKKRLLDMLSTDKDLVTRILHEGGITDPKTVKNWLELYGYIPASGSGDYPVNTGLEGYRPPGSQGGK